MAVALMEYNSRAELRHPKLSHLRLDDDPKKSEDFNAKLAEVLLDTEERSAEERWRDEEEREAREREVAAVAIA